MVSCLGCCFLLGWGGVGVVVVTEAFSVPLSHLRVCLYSDVTEQTYCIVINLRQKRKENFKTFVNFLKIENRFSFHTIHLDDSFPSLHSSQLPPPHIFPRFSLPPFPLQEKSRSPREDSQTGQNSINKTKKKPSY